MISGPLQPSGLSLLLLDVPPCCIYMLFIPPHAGPFWRLFAAGSLCNVVSPPLRRFNPRAVPLVMARFSFFASFPRVRWGKSHEFASISLVCVDFPYLCDGEIIVEVDVEDGHVSVVVDAELLEGEVVVHNAVLFQGLVHVRRHELLFSQQEQGVRQCRRVFGEAFSCALHVSSSASFFSHRRPKRKKLSAGRGKTTKRWKD